MQAIRQQQFDILKGQNTAMKSEAEKAQIEAEKAHKDNAITHQIRFIFDYLNGDLIGIYFDADDPDGDFRHLVVLKNRFTGQTGHAGTVAYNRDTGRLLEETLAQLQNDNEGDA